MSKKLPHVVNNIDVLIENSKVKLIQKNIKIKVNKIIDATNKYVLPGFINCHTHIPMSIFKESCDGYCLQEWLQKFIWPIENKLTDKDIYYFSLLGMLESIANGITTINDMYFLTDNIVKASQICNINLINGPTLMDVDKKGMERFNNLKSIFKKYGEKNISASIHSLYTASEQYLKTILPFIYKNNLLVHMHFCENKQEVIDIKNNYHVKTPTDVLIKYFKNIKLVLAHCVYLNNQDIKNLKTLDASIVHNPTSNLRLGCGIAHIKKYLDNGINVCIGTDGAGSGSNGCVLKEVRMALLLQKGVYDASSSINSYDGLKMITINAAKALGIDNNKGCIEINKDADLNIINLDFSNTSMVNDPISDIVYNVSSSNIETVIANGKILKHNNKIVIANEKEIIKTCKILHKHLFNTK